MRSRDEVGKTIDEILIPFAECIAWKDFGPEGTPCYDPTEFTSASEEEEAAYTLATVELEMKKNSKRHIDLAKKVAVQTGNKYVTFPWLRDAVSRLLADSTYEELMSMTRLSRAVKAGMKAKGLNEIHSIAEILS